MFWITMLSQIFSQNAIKTHFQGHMSSLRDRTAKKWLSKLPHLRNCSRSTNVWLQLFLCSLMLTGESFPWLPPRLLISALKASCTQNMINMVKTQLESIRCLREVLSCRRARTLFSFSSLFILFCSSSSRIWFPSWSNLAKASEISRSAWPILQNQPGSRLMLESADVQGFSSLTLSAFVESPWIRCLRIQTSMLSERLISSPF